jgi:D-glycero-D-manno-heptose 1,7-bisphosphate phosphatase
MQPAIFLDRDGVVNKVRLVNQEALSPRNLDEVFLEDGIINFVDYFKSAGYLILVITNQPDISKNTLSMESVEIIHRYLKDNIRIDDFRICPHTQDNGCNCRKPLPGMIFDLAEKWDVDLANSWLIGDRWVDIFAGNSANLRSILLERPYSWKPTSSGEPPLELTTTAIVDNLQNAKVVIDEDRGVDV